MLILLIECPELFKIPKMTIFPFLIIYFGEIFLSNLSSSSSIATISLGSVVRSHKAAEYAYIDEVSTRPDLLIDR